jgi:hypothetical protein
MLDSELMIDVVEDDSTCDTTGRWYDPAVEPWGGVFLKL